MAGERDQQALYFQAIKGREVKERKIIFIKKEFIPYTQARVYYLCAILLPSSPRESNPIASASTMLLKPVKY